MPYSITPTSAQISEGAGSITFTITRTGSTVTETAFFSTTTSPGFSNGADYGIDTSYTGVLNRPLTFTSTVQQHTVTVLINNDSAPEPNEVFGVLLDTSSGTVLASTTFTIVDNDAAQSTQYSLTPSVTAVTEGNQVTFTIARSGDRPAETVFFSAWADSASYDAGDYQMSNGARPEDIAVNFLANEASRTVTMTILNDGVPDSGERFRAIVQKSPPSSNPADNVAQTGFITISDAAQSTQYALTPSVTAVTEGNQVTFTIARTGDRPAETVFFSAWADSASYDAGDYQMSNGARPEDIAVNFLANEASRTVTMTILNDGVPDSGERFRAIVQKSPPSSNPADNVAQTGFITISDAAQSTQYALTPSVTAVTEGNQVTFTIARTGDRPAETVFFSAWADSASYDAGDYQMSNGARPEDIAVNFLANEASRTVTMTILNDGVPDSGERFRAIVQKSPPSSNPADNVAQTGFITISDAAQSTQYALTPSVTAVTEGNQVTFTIARTGDRPAETVFFSAWADSASYDAGDYQMSNGARPEDIAVNFLANEASRTVTMTILNDGVPDSGERFRAIVQKSPPSSNPADNVAQTSFVTISDGATSTIDDYADEATDTAAPIGTLNVGASVTGIIGPSDPNDNQYGDKDAFAVALQAGKTYTFEVNGSAGLTDAIFTLRDSNFNTVIQSNQGDPASLSYEIETTGTYYLRVGTGVIGQQGEYTLSVIESGVTSTDDYADEPSETGTANGIGNLAVGGSVSGVIGRADANDNQYGDKDAFAVTLQAGKTYTFSVNGSNGLTDAIFTLRDPNFNTVGESNQGDPASLIYDIQTTGTYYVRIGTGIIGQQGQYTLSIAEASEAPPSDPNARTDILQPIIVEMAYLAEAAYAPTSTSRTGWHAVSGPGFSTVNSNDPGDNPIIPNVNLHIYETYIDGVRTLAIAFSGTSEAVSLITQIGQWDELYSDFSSTVSAALSWAEHQQTAGSDPFGKLLVTGHSLGGILVEELLADDSLYDLSALVRSASAITFGSPGSARDVSHDSRLTNFVNLGDPIAMLHSDSFLDYFKGADEEEAGLRKAVLELALTLEGLVHDPRAEAASLLGSGTGQFLSRDGTTVTMVATENTIVDLVSSKAAHGMSGTGGYIDTVSKLSSIFDNSHSSPLGELQAWENSSGGWHFIKPDQDLTRTELTVAFLAGFGFGLLDLAAYGTPRLIVGGHNSFINVSTTLVENIASAVKEGVSNIGNFIEGTIDSLSATFDRTLDYIEIKYNEAYFGDDNVTLREGSAIIELDIDLDSSLDAETHLLGDYDLSRFFTVPGADGTRIVYSKYAQLQASELADILIGSDAGEIVEAFAGDDYILALGGADQVYAGPGDDFVAGGAGADTLYGGPGNDRLYSYAIDFDASVAANDGPNLLDGGDDNDELRGSGAAERLLGGAGDDLLAGRGGADHIDGGDGIDLALISRSHLGTPYTFNFAPGVGGDITEPEGARLISIERVQFSGGTGAETVTGGSNDDLLRGGGGNDVLTGNGGTDRLDGEAGNDTLDGGDGLDVVVFIGNRADYALAGTATSFRITDSVAGRDGTDTVRRVEVVSFADGTFSVSDFLPSGAAPNDFNGDGTTDILVSSAGGAIVAWTIEDGTLSGAPTYVATATGGWSYLDTGDFNGDGTSDILVTNAGGAIVAWTIEDGTLSGAPTYVATAAGGWSYLDTGDFNGDGTSDILVTNAGGAIVAWTIEDGTLSGAPTYVATATGGWSYLDTGDFNGDGTSDILVTNAGGAIVDWTIENGTLSGTPAYVATAAGGWSYLDTGDFNGDGTSDILVTNTGGAIVDWTIEDGTLSGAPTYVATAAGGWSYLDTGDFNGDGTSDILVTNAGGAIVDWTIENGTLFGVPTYIGTATDGWNFLS